MVWVREINVRGPAGGIDPSDAEIIAAVRAAAEDAVADEVQEIGAVVGVPKTNSPSSTWDALPISWTWRTPTSTYDALYSDSYGGSWNDQGRRSKSVPLLRAGDGRLPDSVMPLDVARLSDIPDIPDFPDTPPAVERVMSPQVPIVGAHVAAGKVASNPVAFVFVGSSTTAANPGYVAPLGRRLQDAYLVETPSAPQFSGSAEFTERTAAGIHIYGAGQGGTTASDYLTDAECDRIAALDPALIHHMVGSNDFFMSVDPETYRANMLSRLAYFDSVLTRPAQHVLVHQYERRDSATRPHSWAEYGQVLEDIAASRGDTVFLDLSVPYAATGIPATDPLNLISGDDIHQTARGYAFMTDLNTAFYLA